MSVVANSGIHNHEVRAFGNLRILQTTSGGCLRARVSVFERVDSDSRIFASSSHSHIVPSDDYAVQRMLMARALVARTRALAPAPAPFG